MKIEAPTTVTPETEAPVETQADATAKALAEAAAVAPTSTEEALRAKAEAERTAAAPARPEWLPEGFETPEEFAKAYADLKATKEETPAQTDEKTEDKPKEGEGGDTETNPGFVDLNALTTEYNTNGALTEESYAALAAKGYDKAVVDQFIAGQTALADAAERRITEAAGGKENMERLFAWASTGLSPEEIDTYNKSFAGSDVNAAALAMEGLKTKYEEVYGKDPSLLEGRNKAPVADVFSSWPEVTAAMSDPRYRSDPAYNAKVQAKLARSNNL